MFDRDVTHEGLSFQSGREPDRIAVVRDWVQRELVDSGRLPLFLCFAAFLVTFVTTRVVTRMIRADRGPFKDNVSSSGLHVHHAVPGIVLLVVGAVTAIATDTDTRWSALAAVLVGVGTSLVLDEFALILHLEDVYWAEEGRISVEMVSLAVASMGLVLVGFTPFNLSQEDSAALSVTLGGFALHLVWIVVCVSKGKYKLAFFGVFFTIVALIGAFGWPGPVRAGHAVATGRTSSLEPRHVPPGSTPGSELDRSHGEPKSMHTSVETRGCGVGMAMVVHLVGLSRRRGYARVSLETGAQADFEPARRLYGRAGFAVCGPFAGYPDSTNSVFMTMLLRTGC